MKIYERAAVAENIFHDLTKHIVVVITHQSVEIFSNIRDIRPGEETKTPKEERDGSRGLRETS